jgi:hypothetical protein
MRLRRSGAARTNPENASYEYIRMACAPASPFLFLTAREKQNTCVLLFAALVSQEDHSDTNSYRSELILLIQSPDDSGAHDGWG